MRCRLIKVMTWLLALAFALTAATFCLSVYRGDVLILALSFATLMVATGGLWILAVILIRARI